MNANHNHKGPLVELIRSFNHEIAEFRQHLEEETGHDIAWELAADLWLQRGFAHWKRTEWERAITQATINAERESEIKAPPRPVLDTLQVDGSQIQIPAANKTPKERRKQTSSLSFYRAMRAIGQSVPGTWFVVAREN